MISNMEWSIATLITSVASYGAATLYSEQLSALSENTQLSIVIGMIALFSLLLTKTFQKEE